MVNDSFSPFVSPDRSHAHTITMLTQSPDGMERSFFSPFTMDCHYTFFYLWFGVCVCVCVCDGTVDCFIDPYTCSLFMSVSALEEDL
jgi:hypothetical protein